MKKTTRQLTWRTGQLLLMALLFLLISSPLHQINAATSKAPLGVQPLPAATQRDKSVSYFDLLLGAGQTETMQVKLTNNTNKAITVAVKPTTATSADSGIIDYTGGSNTPDKSMTVKLASLIQGGDSITVPANASATYAAKLTMPTQAIAGVMAGGLVFTPTGQTSTATSGKMGIVNKYSYTVAVLARNNATILTPKLAIGTIKAERTKYVNRISVVLRNCRAARYSGGQYSK